MILERQGGFRSMVWVVASLAVLGSADASAEATAETPSSRHDSWSARLTVGVRLSHVWLEDSRRCGAEGCDNSDQQIHFLGSLWGLDPLGQKVPYPFVEYRVVSVFGAGAAYDRVRIKTLDWGNAEQTMTAGDGDLVVRGGQLYAFASIPRPTRVAPYLRAGYGYYWSDFVETPDWARSGNYFEVENTHGFVVAAGLRIAAWRGMGLDLSYEHLALSEIKAKARFVSGGAKRGAFPPAQNALRVGVAYRF